MTIVRVIFQLLRPALVQQFWARVSVSVGLRVPVELGLSKGIRVGLSDGVSIGPSEGLCQGLCEAVNPGLPGPVEEVVCIGVSVRGRTTYCQ